MKAHTAWKAHYITAQAGRGGRPCKEGSGADGKRSCGNSENVDRIMGAKFLTWLQKEVMRVKKIKEIHGVKF